MQIQPAMKRKAGIVSVSRACFLCKKDHKACNGARPCSRCISLEVPDRCEDVALKPRGRPRKTKVGNTSPDTAATTASSSTTTTSRRMTDGGTSSTVLLRSETTTIVKKREDPRRSSNPTANNARKHSPTNRHSGNHHYNDFPRKNGLTPSSFELGGDPDDDEAALAMVSSFPLLRETAQKSSSSSSHPGLHHPAASYGVSTFPWPYPPSTNTLPITTPTEPKGREIHPLSFCSEKQGMQAACFFFSVLGFASSPLSFLKVTKFPFTGNAPFMRRPFDNFLSFP